MNNTEYNIKPEELWALRELLSFQSLYGTKKATEMNYDGYLGSLEQLARASEQLQNSTFKAWINTFFTGVTNVTDFDKMFVVLHYWRLCGNSPEPRDTYEPRYSETWTSMWHCFTRGWRYRDTGDFDNWVGRCYPNITAPSVWKTKHDAVSVIWFDNPPTEMIDKGVGSADLYVRCRDFEKNILDNWWRTAAQSMESNKTMWTNQMNLFNTMKGSTNTTVYTASDYFFIFHLLVALPTKGDTSTRLENFIKLSGSSDDYENETFINHLIFLVILYLSNPDGTYKYNNAQLIYFIKSTQNIIRTNTKLDEALKSGLNTNLIRLTTDSYYPYPTDNYNDRLASTLNLLNTMKLAPGPASISEPA